MDILAHLRTALPDRYEIEREIGRGGMATVYLARDLRHERQVAFKVLNPELGAVLGLERFQAEIRVTANLQHPNLLPLFDSGEVAGLLFYVMPFVSGESLRARLERERQLPVDDAVRITVSIASALDYAHRNGVIHRDLKPENILLQDGQPVIADFGIALAVSKAGGTRVTQTGLSLGTPEYMSPEQATGDRTIDGRTDIYSLGAVLYEMLIGEPPHTGASVQAIVARVLTDPVRSVRTTRPTVPEHIDAAIERALAKLPADRFATAKEFAEALTSPASAASIRATSSSIRSAGKVAGSRNLRVWQGIAAVAVLAAIGAFAVPRGPRNDPGLQLARQLTFDGSVIGAAISSDGKWLAYVTNDCLGSTERACTNSLRVREVDGTQSILIVTWPYVRGDVRWSPDGSILLFAGAADSVSFGTFLTSRLGGSVRRVPLLSLAHAFDPAGARVVVAAGDGASQKLYFVDEKTLAITDSIAMPSGLSATSIDLHSRSDAIAVAGSFSGVGRRLALVSRQGVLLDSGVAQARPKVRWSADGRALMTFILGPGIADDLVRVPVKGGRMQNERATVSLGQIATRYLGEFDLAVDGRAVVISTQTTHALEVFNTSNPAAGWKRITERTGFIAPSGVSPDGKYIAADATDNLGDNIYAFPLDGSAPRAISAVRGTREYVSWSASGRRVAYGVYTPGSEGIVVVDVSGGRERLIQANEPANETAWLGDSNLVVHRRGSFVRYDTLGKVLDSLRPPASMGFVREMTANAATGTLVYWSQGAMALVAVKVASKDFVTLFPSQVPLMPVSVAADGTIIAFSPSSPMGPDRFVRIPSGANTAVTILNAPGCERPFATERGLIVGCERPHYKPDVWLADVPGRSRW